MAFVVIGPTSRAKAVEETIDVPRITPRIAESVVLTLRICLLLYAGCPSDDSATYSKTVIKAVASAVAANGTAEDPYEYAAVC
jgi:hypothetical protein